jgi:ABC-type multidrug transport system fused ATPase/permease subunit
MLYNIQTIYSFVNLEFETERFNKNIDDVFKCDKDKALKAGLSQSIMGLSSYISFTVAIFFGKKIIVDNKIDNIENGLKVGDILVVILSMSTAVWSFRSIAPNFKIIIDAATSSSDYFNLLNRQPKIHFSLFPIKKNKNEIEG